MQPQAHVRARQVVVADRALGERLGKRAGRRAGHRASVFGRESLEQPQQRILGPAAMRGVVDEQEAQGGRLMHRTTSGPELGVDHAPIVPALARRQARSSGTPMRARAGAAVGGGGAAGDANRLLRRRLRRRAWHTPDRFRGRRLASGVVECTTSVCYCGRWDALRHDVQAAGCEPIARCPRRTSLPSRVRSFDSPAATLRWQRPRC